MEKMGFRHNHDEERGSGKEMIEEIMTAVFGNTYRLIDADRLLSELDDVDFCMCQTFDRELMLSKAGVIDTIRRARTFVIDTKKHTGKWIWDGENNAYGCSYCHHHAYGNTTECFDGTYKFCPFCGAKMEVNNEAD